jgi:RIO kinase 2
VPKPLDQARHCIIMELIDAFPLRQAEVTDPAKLYKTLMELILKFANNGLIHGDFNEFNILVKEDSQEAVIIDFPQMISINHRNAEEQFDRDVQCIKTFFEKKFRYTADDDGPFWSDIKRTGTLDAAVEASGMSKKQAKELEKYMKEGAPLGTNDEGDDDDEDEEEEGGEEEEGDGEGEGEEQDGVIHSGDEQRPK